MRRRTLIGATALLALAGCDRIPFLQGDEVVAGNTAANGSGGNASATAGPSNAGIGSSRSLAGLGGNNGGQGGKDPSAVPAGASQGALDPRFVGRWTDTGDCKTVMDLRPDGTFLASTGVAGRWEVSGDQLLFVANGNEVRLRIDAVEPNRIVTTSEQGQTGPSTRC